MLWAQVRRDMPGLPRAGDADQTVVRIGMLDYLAPIWPAATSIVESIELLVPVQ